MGTFNKHQEFVKILNFLMDEHKSATKLEVVFHLLTDSLITIFV